MDRLVYRHIDGLIVAWSEDEIQAIDGDNFKYIVIDVTEKFFDDVQDPESVSVIWKTDTRNHKTRYDVVETPQLGFDSCYVEIRGGNGGEYRIELDQADLSIRQHSNNWVEELTYLEFKAPGVAVDAQANTIALSEIPEKIKEKAVRAAPKIEL